MKTKIEISIDFDRGEAMILEHYSCPVIFQINMSSLESIAQDVGEALTDYLQGLF